MNHNISVKEFLSQRPVGEDLEDFIYSVKEEAERINKRTNCFITTNPDFANLSAKAFVGEKLFALPLSVKDNMCTSGLKTTAGSKILHNYVPTFNATSVLRARKEGAQILGKTAMDEFGFGTFSVNCAYDIPKNPWDLKRSAGGSSGGAGSITAALNMPHIALAESTGGSISCPAAFCGVVGLTPTYGLVSRYGLIDYANSLDKIGVISRSVWDSALTLSVIAGNDPRDFTSLQQKEKDYTSYCKEGKLKIGVPKEYFDGIDAKIAKEAWNAIYRLEGEGFSYQEVSLPSTKYALASYYIIAVSEASTNLAKFCGLRYGLSKELEGDFNEYFSEVRSAGFGQEAKRRIILGTYARMAGYRDAFYLKALKVRTVIINEFKSAFKKVDVLASPTMPLVAPKLDEIEKLSPIDHYKSDILTVPPNLAGMPHISVPCGSSQGLPVGLHLIGDHLQEGKLIQAAHVYEKLRGEIKYPAI